MKLDNKLAYVNSSVNDIGSWNSYIDLNGDTKHCEYVEYVCYLTLTGYFGINWPRNNIKFDVIVTSLGVNNTNL